MAVAWSLGHEDGGNAGGRAGKQQDGGWIYSTLHRRQQRRRKEAGLKAVDEFAVGALGYHIEFTASLQKGPQAATDDQRADLTLTEGQDNSQAGQWIKDLAAGRRTFAGRLADRQSLMIPSEDPDYGDLGQAFPSWTGPGKDAILQPPKPEITPSAAILQLAAEHDIEPEAGG